MNTEFMEQAYLVAATFERLGWTLLHFVWQGLALSLVAWTLFILTKNRSPNVRYLIGLAVLSLMVACPIFTFTAIGPKQKTERYALVDSGTPSAELKTQETGEISDQLNSPNIQSHFSADKEMSPEFSEARIATISNQVSVYRYASQFVPFAVVAWLIGVAILSLRLLCGWLGILRLRNRVTTTPDWIVNVAAKTAKSMSIDIPLIRLSNQFTEAIAVGFFKPMILLPMSWLTELPPDMIEAIVAHEMAHIRRGDLWVNLAQRIVETLLFYHPAVWWLSNRIRVERELCCDAEVIKATQDPLRYAETLEHIGRMVVQDAAPELAVPLKGPRRVLLARIRALLGQPTNEKVGSAWLAGLIPILVVLVVLVSMMPSQESSAESIPTGSSSFADNKLTISVSDADDNRVTHAYLTLWKALELEEGDPENTVNGTSGFGLYNPVIWIDAKTKVRWMRQGSAHPNDGRHSKKGVKQYEFATLPNGRYRVTAMSYQAKVTTPDPSPYGVSEDVVLTGTDESEMQIQFAAGAGDLKLHVIDKESRKPLSGIALRLRTADGMPVVHGHGNGNFFERTDDQGEVRFGKLPAGEFSIELLGKRTRVNQSEEYLPMSTLTKVTVNPGSQKFEIELPATKLTKEEIDKRNPFSIFGRVTDSDGKPLEGAVVRAATGIGTLWGGGSTKTDAHGNYKLYFGPGGRTRVSESAPNGVGVQAVNVYVGAKGWKLPGKDGYVFMLMTDQPKKEFETRLKAEGKIWSKSDSGEVVFANEAKELNFVLVKEANMPDSDGSENIVWGPSRNGLVAGAKLLSSTSKLAPGDPVVVQFVLKNEAKEEQTVVLQAMTSHPSLGGSNRLELGMVGNSQQTYQHTLKAGEILESRQYRINVSTTGMPQGEYHITSGSAFWMSKKDKPNQATGIPFRKKIPFTLGDPSAAKLKQPPEDKDSKAKTYWGKPAGSLVLGMRLADGRESWPDDEVDIEGHLFLFNAGEEPVALSYDIPPTPADWNMHATSRDHNKLIRLDSTWFTGLEPTRTRDLTLKPGEVVQITGVRGEVSTGGKKSRG